jgi:hypothetical protein
MAKRVGIWVCLAVLGLTLAGCSPCGFFWEDWRSGKVCRGEPAPK